MKRVCASILGTVLLTSFSISMWPYSARGIAAQFELVPGGNDLPVDTSDDGRYVLAATVPFAARVVVDRQ